MVRHLVVVLRGVAALAAPERFARELAAADHAREIEHNSGLRGVSTADRDRHLSRSRDLVIQRLQLLRRALGSSLLLIASALAVGLIVHSAVPFDARATRWLSVASLFMFAWATLGRLGWAGQSFGGDTSVEKLDKWLFRLLYWLAMVAGTAALA